MITLNQPTSSSLLTQHVNFTELADFQPRQEDAWFTLMDPLCKYLLYGGAAYGGKSYWLRWTAIGLGMYYYAKYGIKNVPIGLFSEDYPTLKDRQVVKMKHEIPPFVGKVVESRDEGYAFIGAKEYGSFIILLRNLDDPGKYSSVEFAAIGVEELTKNPRPTFDDLRFRLRYPGIEDVKLFAATNPGGIGHGFVKRLWIEPNPQSPDIEQDRFFFVGAKYSDNKFTTDGYVKQLEALPEDKRKAYKDGSWDTFAGQYFPEFDKSLHVIEPHYPEENSVIVGGMDWGRTAPFAFVLSEVSVEKQDGVAFHRSKIFFEVYGTEKTPKQWATIIKQKLSAYGLTPNDIAWIRGDPAMFTKGNDNSMAIADQFKENGIKITPASNDRVGGWENLHKWLSTSADGFPYLQITSNCVNLLFEIPNAVHDETKVEDLDTAGIDHALDAVRYLHKHLKWLDAKRGAGPKPGATKKLPANPYNVSFLSKFKK